MCINPLGLCMLFLIYLHDTMKLHSHEEVLHCVIINDIEILLHFCIGHMEINALLLLVISCDEHTHREQLFHKEIHFFFGLLHKKHTSERQILTEYTKSMQQKPHEQHSKKIFTVILVESVVDGEGLCKVRRPNCCCSSEFYDKCTSKEKISVFYYESDAPSHLGR